MHERGFYLGGEKSVFGSGGHRKEYLFAQQIRDLLMEKTTTRKTIVFHCRGVGKEERAVTENAFRRGDKLKCAMQIYADYSTSQYSIFFLKPLVS